MLRLHHIALALEPQRRVSISCDAPHDPESNRSFGFEVCNPAAFIGNVNQNANIPLCGLSATIAITAEVAMIGARMRSKARLFGILKI